MLAFALGWVLASTVAAQPAAPIDPADAEAFFAHARMLSEADNARLWGVSLYGPILFVDPETRAVVTNQGDASGALTRTGALWTGTLPDTINIANTAFEWNGTHWTMLMWPLPESKYARGTLLMHECFHRIQDELGLPARSPLNTHLDARDGRVWLILEWRALTEALLHDGQKRAESIHDALLFRAMRHRACADAAAQERELELNEGLAEYTGVRLCGAPVGTLRIRAALAIEQAGANPGALTRSFAYKSGPAYGLLLDATDPNWRTKLTPETDLGALLESASGFSLPTSPVVTAHERAGVYDGRRLMAAEDAREQRRLARLADYDARFVRGPVLIVPLTTEVSYGFNPYGLESVDPSSTVYQTLELSDAWGTCQVTSGGALMKRADDRVVEARIGLTQDFSEPPTSGAGWTLSLRDGWALEPGDRPGDWIVRKHQR